MDTCKDIPRAHHASALLLPDARVLIAGGDIYEESHAAENLDAQIFSPPYLFTVGGADANRPDIDIDGVDGRVSCDFPTDGIIAYWRTFTVNFWSPGGISAVNLIALGAATHSFDQSQRFIDLTFTTAPGVLTVAGPSTPEAAPPGYYMLFIIDDDGVPSLAEIIKLDATCPAFDPPPARLPAPTSPDGDAPKNRYLSFEPQNNMDVVAFELELTDCPQFPESVGERWWVDEPSVNVFAGDTYYISSLSKTPFFSENWGGTEGVVHIGDCRVVPVAGYALRATSESGTFSAPLALSTIPKPGANEWGDVVWNYNGSVWLPPQGVTNIDDAFAAIQGFQELNAPPLTWVDVEPEEINHVVNIADVLHIILAFQGASYPFSAPADCSPCRSAPPCIGDPVTFTLVAGSPFIDAGAGVDIEVFIDSVPDLGGYQVTLEVTGGTSGALVLTDVTVDTAHPDYVFAGLSEIPTPDIPRGRVGNALIGTQSGVPVSGPGYLATFSYIPSELAYGDFHVEVLVGPDDTLPMDSTVTRLAYNGGSCTVIGVGFDCHVDADCDDGNDCTIDTCVNDACILTDAASGTACDDGLFCTTTGQCDGSGTCVGSGSPCPPKFPVCCELADTCIAVGVQCSAPI